MTRIHTVRNSILVTLLGLIVLRSFGCGGQENPVEASHPDRSPLASAALT